VIFEQKDVEVPKTGPMTATNIVASKYLHGKVGTPERETGVRQLVTRVAETIRNWDCPGLFQDSEDGATFHDELVHVLVRQYAAFNSPVWFNVGCDRIEPTLTHATGTGIRKLSKSNSASPDTARPSAPRVS